MKTTVCIALATVVLLSGGTPVIAAAVPAEFSMGRNVVEHGGGCRKNSPPGMCCHMDHKAGTVHCH